MAQPKNPAILDKDRRMMASRIVALPNNAPSVGGRRGLFGKLWKAALAAVLIIAAVSTAPLGAKAADRNVLFVSSFDPTLPWTEAMLTAIKEEVEAGEKPVNVFFEFLDRARLPNTPNDTEWAAFLAAKYRHAPPDVIIADAAPAIRFAAEFGSQGFGAAPLIGILPNFRALGELADTVAVRVTTGPHIDQTVEMALAQRPAARKAIIVSDQGAQSLHLSKVIAAALARSPSRTVEIEHLFDFRLEELEAKLAALPNDSIVFYTHVFEDNTGRRFIPRDVATRLAMISAAPIYVFFDVDIGTGVVGGYVNNSRLAGKIAIRAAFDLLKDDGHSPAQGATRYSSQMVVDWRAMRRWGIDQDSLSPEAEIRFRQPSLFEEYLYEALMGLVFIGVLSAALVVISSLYVQRGHLARTLRETNSRLEERVAARTRDIERALTGERTARQRLRTFVDMATHEFKTPLATIDSTAQVLELLVDTERDGIDARLALIRRSVRRVVDLVETCLDGERIDEELPVKFRPFAPEALILGVIERQRGLGSGDIAADISGLPSECVADPDLLGIALDALLDNARRYGPAEGPIEVTACHDGTSMVMSVCDRGGGVPEDEAPHIFEKYYRGSHSRALPGTGIGLNLVKTIAELHGGGVAYRPRPGGGAMFVLTIPLDQAAAEAMWTSASS
ncbi:MAG TPA: HAMP domain-containing sensor histidine kinase [Azospirillaceae bacterium]|nr:HAMP domain-containing sensor histidine kinase [Azospirillaceae bacterium]